MKLKLHLIFLIGLSVSVVAPCQSQKQKSKPEIGIASGFENDSLLYTNGYRYLVESVPRLLSPVQVSEQAFRKNVKIVRGLQMKLYAVNIFIPGELKVVGPDVNEEAVLTYVRSVFSRCRQAGIAMMVFGSGGARRIPEGFNREKAKQQIISMAGRISDVAKEFDIIIALENLNSHETNFINTVGEALEIVKAVDHPNFRLCVDIYHMLMEGESPEIIGGTKDFIIHCDIAEKEGRAAPGTKGEDFTPYLKALSDIGYDDKIIIEARWENIAQQSEAAFVYLQKQIDKVY